MQPEKASAKQAAKPKARSPDSETLMRERVACPHCGRVMTLRNLHYQHVCSTPKTPAEIENMRAKATAAAHKAHNERMEKREEKQKEAEEKYALPKRRNGY